MAIEGMDRLRLRPRAAALLWVVPLSGIGFFMSWCGSAIVLMPNAVASNNQPGYLALAIGLPLLLIPVLNLINAQVSPGRRRSQEAWCLSECLTMVHLGL